MIALIKRLIFRVLTVVSTWMAKRKVAAWGQGFTVNYPCVFTRETTVGAYCHFNGIRVIGGGRFVVGDYFHSGDGILVLTQNHNWKSPETLPYDSADQLRDVTIGDYVWMGSRSILLPGATLGSGCIVQAGAVVSGAVPENAVVGGNPAKVLKYRDPALVDALVKSGKFLL
jgi:chloramphenicol O-acetyltransferase type B